MARGGKRTPDRPAPASPPGALSARTDGGAQPIREAVGGTPGVQNAALPQLQQQAPLSAGGSAPTLPGVGASPPNPEDPGVFGPSTRPNEDPTIGLSPPGQQMRTDPDALTRILYSLYPHPDIARLLSPNGAP